MAQNLEQKVNQLEQELKELKRKYAVHQHSDVDGTNMLRKNIKLDIDQGLIVGLSDQQSIPPIRPGTATAIFYHAFSVGEDNTRSGIVNKTNNMQISYLHQPGSTVSAFYAGRKPLVVYFQGTSISTTAAGNTVTIAGYNFTTNELATALINIYDSTGAYVETQTIASNTATVVTISGTWLNTTSGGIFIIYRPVYLGITDFLWQRLYVQESTDGGIRFGVGPTAGGQNGLLYSDATGDLYWRNKSGVSTKLN